LSIVILTSSCDSQVGTGIQTAIKNLFNGDMFAQSASDEAYQALKDSTLKDETTNPEILRSCEKLM